MGIEALAIQVNLAPSREESDNELVAKCRSGDLEAFDELVKRYRNRIFNLSWQLLGDRDEAEDVAQEVFLHAFEHMGDFRYSSQVFTWFYRIAVNACKMRLRKRRPIEPLDEREPCDIDWHEVEERWILKRQVDIALSRLPEKLRIVLVLREMHELSYEEIAQVLSVPVGTVRSRLFEARKKFAQIWRELFDK